MNRLKRWAHIVRRDILALYIAARDPRTPWYAKALATFVVAYALSPIDLIPDFIPVIGYLDDLLLVPAGLWLATKLVPADVIEECRARAAQLADRPVSRTAAAIIVTVWVAAAIVAGWFIFVAGMKRSPD